MRYSYQTHLAKVETISRAYGSNAALINDEVKKYEVFSSALGVSLATLSLVWAAYQFAWPNTGFQGKTIWDWLQLLIIPFVLALLAYFSTK